MVIWSQRAARLAARESQDAFRSGELQDAFRSGVFTLVQPHLNKWLSVRREFQRYGEYERDQDEPEGHQQPPLRGRRVEAVRHQPKHVAEEDGRVQLEDYADEEAADGEDQEYAPVCAAAALVAED